MYTEQNPYVAMSWQWDEVPTSDSTDLSFGILHDEIFASIVEVTGDSPSIKALNSLKRQEEVCGRLNQSAFLWHSFERDRDRLLAEYDLSQDGNIDASIMQLPNVYYSLVSDFCDFVVAGNRLLEKMHDWIQSVFPSGNTAKDGWASLTHQVFDNSLAYALFDQYRNEIEHGFCPISIVNFDPANGKVGAALNLEAGIMQRKSVKSSVKKRLEQFRCERRNGGLMPWLSISNLVHSYDNDVSLLYLCFLCIMFDEFKKRHAKLHREWNDDINCIHWNVIKTARIDSLYSINRVYKITDLSDLSMIKYIASKVSEHIKMNNLNSSTIYERVDEMFASAFQ